MKKLTYGAYMLFIFTGYIFTIMGIVSKDIATTFGVTDADIIFRFMFFTIGSTSGIFLNGILLEKLSYKKEIIMAFLFVVFGIIGIVLSNSLFLFALFMTISGLGVGFIVSLGNHVIISIYEKERVQKLNILNFFYSFGSVIGPLIAAEILKSINGKTDKVYGNLIYDIANHRNWGAVYIFGILILLIVSLFLISCKAKINEKEEKEENSESVGKKEEKWNIYIYMIAAAIFFYVLAEMIVTYWIVGFMVDIRGVDGFYAARALSCVWGAMTVGRFLSGYLTAKIKSKTYILILSFIALIGIIGLLFMNGIYIYVAAAVLGLGYSGMYATILSFGTHQLKTRSTKLMTFLVSVGSAGSIAASPISGGIKKVFGIYTTLSFAAVFILAVIILITFIKTEKN